MNSQIKLIESIGYLYPLYDALIDYRANIEWYKPKSIAEIEMLNNYFNSICEGCESYLDESDIDKWCCIDYIEDGYLSVERDAFSTSVNTAKDFFKQFGLSIEIKDASNPT